MAITGAITVYTVESLRDQLLERLNTDCELTVDLSGVDACDCAGLQLLCAARKSAEQTGKPLHFNPVPESILNAARDAGLETKEFLDMPKPL